MEIPRRRRIIRSPLKNIATLLVPELREGVESQTKHHKEASIRVRDSC